MVPEIWKTLKANRAAYNNFSWRRANSNVSRARRDAIRAPTKPVLPEAPRSIRLRGKLVRASFGPEHNVADDMFSTIFPAIILQQENGRCQLLFENYYRDGTDYLDQIEHFRLEFPNQKELWLPPEAIEIVKSTSINNEPISFSSIWCKESGPFQPTEHGEDVEMNQTVYLFDFRLDRPNALRGTVTYCDSLHFIFDSRLDERYLGASLVFDEYDKLVGMVYSHDGSPKAIQANHLKALLAQIILDTKQAGIAATNSDANADKLARTPKKQARKAAKSSDSDEDSRDDRDGEDNKLARTPKKVVPSKSKKAKARKAAKSSDSEEDSSDDSDGEDNKLARSPKKVVPSKSKKAKQARKAAKSSDFEEDSSDDSDGENNKLARTPKKPKIPHCNKVQTSGGTKTLFMGNVPFSADYEQVKRFFADVAEVVDARLAAHDDGHPKGFCHVVFASVEEANKALKELNGQDFNGRAVRLAMAADRGASAPRTRYGGSFGKPSGGPSFSVFVKGFDASLGRNHINRALMEHFSKCGDITRVSVPVDYESGECKGIAYMDFSDVRSFNKALKLSGSDIGGCILHVSEAMPKGDFTGGLSSSRDGGRHGGGRFGRPGGRDGGRRGGRALGLLA